MSLNLKQILPEDRTILEPYIVAARYRTSEYSFEFLTLWEKALGLVYDIAGGFLLVRATFENKHAWLPPIGAHGDPRAAMEAIMEDAGKSPSFWSVTAESRYIFDEYYPDRFQLTHFRNGDDYIYERERLATLAGKKLHAKRNHVNRFRTDYPDFEFLPLTPDLLPACREMNRRWCAERDCAGGTLAEESRTCCRALSLFETLGMQGAVIRIGGDVVAFTLAKAQYPGSDTMEVFFEKALDGYNGLYTAINQMFVERYAGAFTYINRQDDSGAEGLRRAKLSYDPFEVREKYSARPV